MRALWCLPPSMVQWAGPDASTPESSAEASADNCDSAIGHAGRRYETGTDDSATMVARINAALSEQGLSLTEFLPADSNELAFLLDILKDLGWSALDRARARKAVRTVHSKATDASVHISIHIWMHMYMPAGSTSRLGPLGRDVEKDPKQEAPPTRAPPTRATRSGHMAV